MYDCIGSEIEDPALAPERVTRNRALTRLFICSLYKGSRYRIGLNV